MVDVAQLAQDAKNCAFWASALAENIEDGTELPKLLRLAFRLSDDAGKLNAAISTMQAAAQGKEDG